MNHLSPYPNQGEILRFLAVALDLKAGNKYIDEYARNGLLSSYLHLVKTLSLAGLPRSISLPLLASYCFSWYATDFFYQFESVVAGPQTLACLVIPGYSAIRAAVQWLERNVEGWSTSHEKWSKEQKDRLTVWCKGTELPSYSYIMTLPDWLKEGGAVIDRAMTQKIQCLFLIARAVQWCKKTEAGMGAVEMTNRFLWSNEEIYDVGTELSLAKNEYNKKYDELGGIATVLTDSLALYHEKPITAQRETREQLNEMRGMLVKLDPDGLVSYHANWLEAKWFVFAGDLAQALVLYKKAFEQCLYTAGERQKDIILQALVVAAMMEDKPFLKRLKNQAIVFDWFVAPTLEDDSKINNHKSRARTNVVEDWEVDAFKANFKQMFAPNSWFVGCDYPQAQDCLGPFLSVDFDKIKPDYKNPNRKIKIGDVRTKITPQLVWFSEREQLDVVEKLLAEGATVNVHSHSGETPILMAVQAMNTLIPGTLLNDRCFKMVSAHEHQSEIINMRSTKRKLLPLICSVYSGRPAVVAKLLELGAEVDRRGGIDNQTALNHTIGLIGKRLDLVKYTAGVNRDFNNPTEANLESLRRSFAGLTGITKKQQAEAMANMRNNDKFREYMDSGLQALVGGMAKSLSLDALRQTAHVLIIKPLKN